MSKYRLLYFASLRDAAGFDAETFESSAIDARSLYDEVAQARGLRMSPRRIRVAINGEFVAWEQHLSDGDEVAFLPPVSGG
ncbi:MAG: MoaD/ThiS family protein [Tahibacter sp.]